MVYKKLISSILVVAFLNLLGCSITQVFSASEYKQIDEKVDKSDEFHIITKDGQENHFTEPKYIIKSDTLHVKGLLTTYSEQDSFQGEEYVDRNFALSDIELIRSNTILMSGKPFFLFLPSAEVFTSFYMP